MLEYWLPSSPAARTHSPSTPQQSRHGRRPYRNWYYQPKHVISANPKIPGYESFTNTDVPTVYQVPGDSKWYMSFIAFNGNGYNSFVAESADLLHWTNPQLAMGFGKDGEFDHGGRVIGGYLYESYDIKAPRVLKKHQDKYWTLYGAYPKQGGYELRPGQRRRRLQRNHWARYVAAC